MGLIVLPGPEGVPGPTWLTDQKIWRTDDGRLVRDGDVDAAFLVATPGDPIPLEAAQRLGLAPTPEPVVARKQRRPAQNKARMIRDVQQKERETLREQQARERAVTEPEPEVETDG